jgi:hypothetical protein
MAPARSSVACLHHLLPLQQRHGLQHALDALVGLPQRSQSRYLGIGQIPQALVILPPQSHIAATAEEAGQTWRLGQRPIRQEVVGTETRGRPRLWQCRQKVKAKTFVRFFLCFVQHLS